MSTLKYLETAIKYVQATDDADRASILSGLSRKEKFKIVDGSNLRILFYSASHDEHMGSHGYFTDKDNDVIIFTWNTSYDSKKGTNPANYDMPWNDSVCTGIYPDEQIKTKRLVTDTARDDFWNYRMSSFGSVGIF